MRLNYHLLDVFTRQANSAAINWQSSQTRRETCRRAHHAGDRQRTQLERDDLRLPAA